MTEPTGFLRIATGAVKFVPAAGKLGLARTYSEIGCACVGFVGANRIGPELVIVCDDEFRLKDGPQRVTLWLCSGDKAYLDLGGVLLICGLDEHGRGDLCGAPVSALVAALRRAVLVAPEGLDVPLGEAEVRVLSFSDPEAFGRYLTGEAQP